MNVLPLVTYGTPWSTLSIHLSQDLTHTSTITRFLKGAENSSLSWECAATSSIPGEGLWWSTMAEKQRTETSTSDTSCLCLQGKLLDIALINYP